MVDKTRIRRPQEQILNEPNLLKRLKHPNIVTLHEMKEEKDAIYLVMDCLSGPNIQQLIDSNTPISSEELKKWARQLVSALYSCHGEAGVFHRDIKPDNLMLDADRNLVLIDFGQNIENS